jgi:hypothetical protein
MRGVAEQGDRSSLSAVSGRVNSAHRCHSSTAPISIRAVEGQRGGKAFLISLASPAAFSPAGSGPRNDRDNVDPARRRIG